MPTSLSDDGPSTALLSRLSGYWQRKEYHADCPFCGKPPKRGQIHFSLFCSKQKGWGYKCHVCGRGGGLLGLEDYFGLREPRDDADQATERPVTPHQTIPAQRNAPKWQIYHNDTIERLCSNLRRVERWQAYKPLSLESISRWRLGVGVLPASRCKLSRLVVPVFDNGQLVALHGRAYRDDDHDTKWLTSAGSRKDVLFNAEYLAPGKTVIICENLVDSIIAMQDRDDVVAVASGGVAWAGENLERWVTQIAASQPKHIIVWLDNDLAGQASGAVYARLMREWLAEMRQRVATGKIPKIPPRPQPTGPKIANALLQAGQRVHLYQWPASAPPKADLGWSLQAA